MTATIIPWSQAWRERVTNAATSTLLCGWCLGPPGARRPHLYGVPSDTCPCGCHRRPKPTDVIRTRRGMRHVETNQKAKDFFTEGGGDAAA